MGGLQLHPPRLATTAWLYTTYVACWYWSVSGTHQPGTPAIRRGCPSFHCTLSEISSEVAHRPWVRSKLSFVYSVRARRTFKCDGIRPPIKIGGLLLNLYHS